LRGGSWGDYSYDSRGSRRGNLYPVTPGSVGFRVARNP
jgi:formylglycine-generating enzyme required for sulfatase activity